MSTNYLGLQNYKKLSEKILSEFEGFSQHFSGFQVDQKLSCLSGCGKCCFKPDIFATPIEMLPLALEIIERGEGEAVYQKCLEHKNERCIFLKIDDEKNYKAHCGEYSHRPLICRTFGVSARHNKLNKIEYSVCKMIKEEKKEEYAQLLSNTNIPVEDVPFIDFSRSHIATIDPRFLEEEIHINEAMRKMLEKLLMLNQYNLDS